MSILSAAIQQKKKKNAGEAAPSPATTNKQRSILASAIQAKKNGTIFSAPTVNPAAIRSYNAYKASVPQITTGIAGNDSWKRPNDVSDFDYSETDLALDNTTDYNRLAELKIAADREAERNKYAVSALGAGGKSTSAKIAYETYLAEHTIPSAQEKVYTSEDSLVYQMLKDRAEAEKRQQSLPETQRVQGLDPSQMGSLSGFADAFKSVSGTPAQDAFDDFRRRNIDYNSYLNAADFEEYSKKGAEIQNPTFEEAQGRANIFGWRPGASDVGNIVTFSRDNLDKIEERMASDDRSQFVGNALYGHMTEDQVKIYNYILAKEGKEAAQIYLDSIAETLNKEYGKKVAATVESTRGTALHPIMVAGTATSAGLDQYIGGVKQAFNEYEQPTSGIQYAGQAVREDQGVVGKFAYDAISTLSNMAPSILASYVAMGLGVPAKAAEWVAAGSIGLGSGGNAYKQALAEGRSRDEAKNVAFLTGASEAVLSKLLSGISAVGGLAPEKLLPKVAAIEKGIWRVAAAASIKIGGELSEELLQLYLEPLYKTLIYGDKYDAPTVEEVAYTALLTMVTTGLLEGGDIAKYRTKEGAAEAVRADLQEDTQSKPAGISESQNAPGQVQAENAPVTAETEKQDVFPPNLRSDASETQTAAPSQQIVSKLDNDTKGMSSLDIETIRVALAESHETGRISDADYDAAMEAIMEQESLSDTGSGSLDMYNPQLIGEQEVNTNGRSSISDDSSQWAASQSAGEQAGELAEGTGRDHSWQVQSQRAASRRNDVASYYESRGQSAVNAREFLGTKKVNKVSTVQEMPVSMVSEDSELAAIAEEIRALRMTPHFFTGEAYLQNGNTVDAMIRDNEIYIRVDSEKWTAAQNWEHEKAHAALRLSPGIEAELYGKIVGRGEAARRKLHQTMQRYREAYHGIYDMDENGNEIWDDTVQEMILQEILADAYAGKDTFAQGVEEYADMSQEAVSQIEERGGEVRGPPEESFSVKRTRVVPYQKQIDAYYKNDAKVLGRSDDIFVLDTTSDLSDLGLGEKPFFMLKSNLTKSVRKEGNNKSNSAHGIEEEVVRDLPDLIKSPALVVVGDGRISIISDVSVDTKNESNAPLLIGIDPQSSVDGQDAYEIKSIYGRERFSDWLELRAKDSKILAGNANKAAALLRNVGKSYPEPVAYATDLTSRILSQSETPVKRGESFSARESAQESSIDPIEAMPAKARKFMESAENKLQRSLAQVVGYSEKVSRDTLAEISRRISLEFLQTGTVSDETIDRSFEKIYNGIEADVEQEHGIDAEDYRQWAERDYIAEVSKYLAELRLVRRYAVEKAEKAAAEKSIREMTMEDLTQAYADLKAARRGADKAVARNLLTDEDNRKVNALLRGDLDLDMLRPDQDNVHGITEVYNAKLEYEKIARRIRQWNAQRKQGLSVLADELLVTAGDWTDKKAGILYSRETMERNIRDIVPDKDVAQKVIDTLFKPVHEGAAASNKMKNEYRARVRELNLSRKVAKGNAISEAAAVQLLGEAEDNIKLLQQNNFLKERDGKTLDEWNTVVKELWETNPNLDAQKIRKAIDEFRVIYDELFSQMNEARIRNGYEPVNYRKGYFPHFQNDTGDGILSQFGKSLGINTAALQLPTTINGLTHTFKPGMQWFGSAQQRLGYETTFDAVEGFDSYIEGVADVIHQTDNIQRLRAFASQVRYRTSDDGLRKQVDQVKNDPHLAELDKHNRIKEIYEDGRYELGNFAVELDEYTNLLAGKKSRHDRDMEQRLGRRCYAIMKALEGRVAANMVAINPGSWLTNFIPITQGAATLDTSSLLSGMWDTLRAYKSDDGFVASSSFLTNRRGSDPLVRTWAQSASATLSSPMELIDSFTADTLVRARYNENKRRGLSDMAAMADADTWAAGVMADRSKGAMPTLFSQTNPLTKLFTQFQLEVNNQLSYVFKDIPRETLEKGALTFVTALLKFMLGAYLYDEIYEYVIGRRPALDPLGIINDTVGDITGYELPNLIEWGVNTTQGKETSFKVEKKDPYAAVESATAAILEELPFIGSLMGGGRLPISSALPDWENLGKALFSDGWDEKKKWTAVGKELAKPATYLALPFGGGQVKKALEGGKAVLEGGSYGVNSKGEQILQYPVYNDTPGKAIVNAARAMMFGKSSLPEAQNWVESDFNSLGVKQTALYESLLKNGAAGEEAYQLILDIENADGKANKLQVIADSSLNEDLKELALTKQFTFSQYKKYMAARSADISTSDYIEFLDLLRQEANTQHLENREGKPTTSEVESEMWSSDLSAEIIRQFWGNDFKLSKEYEKMYEQFEAETEPGDGSITATVMKKVLNKTSFTRRQKRAIWKSYGWKSDCPW